MVILALLIGLVAGAAGVYAVGAAPRARRPRPGGPRGARRATRALAETEGALAAERGAFDVRVENAIKALSTEALRANANAFTEQAMGRLGVFVEPLQKSLDKVELNVGLLEQQRQRAYGEIHKELEIVRQNNEGLRTQTGNLVSALRGNSQVRGPVGRDPAAPRDRDGRDAVVLRLRRAADDSGRRRPRAPPRRDREAAGREVDRDRLEGVPRAATCRRTRKGPTTPSARPAWPTTHGRCATTSRRSARRRTGGSCQDTPEFVVMFLHDESSWLAALDVDPSLHELALSNNVIPASPTNLIGLLRAVHYGWQQETIAEGARQISDLGRELYKRLSTMGAHVSKLGRSLDGAVKSYNETVGSLERQVLPQARRFEQHGITGIEPPELVPIDRQTRALSAQELIGDSTEGAIPLEIRPGRRQRCVGTELGASGERLQPLPRVRPVASRNRPGTRFVYYRRAINPEERLKLSLARQIQ